MAGPDLEGQVQVLKKCPGPVPDRRTSDSLAAYVLWLRICLTHLKAVLRYLNVTQKGIASPQRDIDLEVPHVAATLCIDMKTVQLLETSAKR